MGFNKRKMEDWRQQAAENEAAALGVTLVGNAVGIMQHARIIGDRASRGALAGWVCATFTLLIRSHPGADNARSPLRVNSCRRWRA